MMTAEQEKCEYCTFKGDYYKDVNDEIKINYCPICGRKL